MDLKKSQNTTPKYHILHKEIFKYLKNTYYFKMEENISFDIKKVGYRISWSNTNKPQPEGYSVISNILNLQGALIEHNHEGTPSIALFSNLEEFLNGEKTKWFNLPSDGPKHRKLTQKEKKVAYDIMMPELIKIYSPQNLAELILPMYY